MPADDIVWKHVRLQGISIIVAFAYFKCTAKLDGSNLVLVDIISKLYDEGHNSIVLLADFNFPPEVWRDSPYLELWDMQVKIPVGTCKTASGYSLLDYMLVSNSIAPLIKDFRIVPGTHWSPHLALAFWHQRQAT